MTTDTRDTEGVERGPGSNTGHGHVWPRPDGVKARCGGPSLCAECARDSTAKLLSEGSLEERVATLEASNDGLMQAIEKLIAIVEKVNDTHAALNDSVRTQQRTIVTMQQTLSETERLAGQLRPLAARSVADSFGSPHQDMGVNAASAAEMFPQHSRPRSEASPDTGRIGR